MTINLLYNTSTGKALPFELIIKEIDQKSIKTNKKLTTKLCKFGCKMYGKRGGCPPIAPDFNRVYRNKWKHSYLLIIKIPTEKWVAESVLNMKDLSKKVFLTIGQVEVKVKILEKEIVQLIRKTWNCKVFPSSWCNACQKCNVALGNKCLNPKGRGYSIEAIGIMVDDTLKANSMNGLEWCNFKTKTIPNNFQKVILILSHAQLNWSCLKGAILLNTRKVSDA